MVRKRFALGAALVALLVLLWATGGVVAGPPAEGPGGGVTIAGTVASSISYQGRLTDADGNPVPDDTYTMQFQLYDAQSGGTMLWDSGAQSVQVANGLFNVELDVDQADFNGQELWLRVQVAGEWMTDRQQILPVPYALSLRPGAVISDTTSYVRLNHYLKTVPPLIFTFKHGVYAKAEGATFNYGVYGLSSGAGAGVYGSSDTSTGVEGYSTGGDGVRGTSTVRYGVYGNGGSDTDDYGGYFVGWRGVYGEGEASYGGYFVGANVGLHAETDATDGRGLRGYANATSGTNYGVVGMSNSPSGYGGYFYNNASNGDAMGVYGKSNSVNGYGGYFENTTSGDTSSYGVYGKIGTWAGSAGYFRSDSYGTGVTGYSTGGTGVYAYGIPAIFARSDSGSNIIEAWSSGTDREFRVERGGNVHCDGSFIPGGGDLAEMMPGTEGLMPGDVLVVGPDGKLAGSTEPYATNVVGVYSTNPGFVGGSDEDGANPGKVPLAVLGVVPVKASAENGPIKPGDLLTTSSTPGHVMRADHFVGGAIIGKALEGLSEGAGVIKMLVMLQ